MCEAFGSPPPILNLAGDVLAIASTPVPGPDTVELWCVSLSTTSERLALLATCLSSAEHARAARFHFERDRRRYVAARGVLRSILGGYLSERPELVRIDYGTHGKPYLSDHPDLQFNISHAGDVLLIGAAYNRQLGVDIEAVPSQAVVNSVSPIVFSAPERAQLQGTPPRKRCELFAQLWTRKEAYIKADGRGMSLQLDELDVGTVPGRVLRRDITWNDRLTCSVWSLSSIPTTSGFAAAVAAEGIWQVVYHKLDLADDMQRFFRVESTE